MFTVLSRWILQIKSKNAFWFSQYLRTVLLGLGSPAGLGNEWPGVLGSTWDNATCLLWKKNIVPSWEILLKNILIIIYAQRYRIYLFPTDERNDTKKEISWSNSKFSQEVDILRQFYSSFASFAITTFKERKSLPSVQLRWMLTLKDLPRKLSLQSGRGWGVEKQHVKKKKIDKSLFSFSSFWNNYNCSSQGWWIVCSVLRKWWRLGWMLSFGHRGTRQTQNGRLGSNRKKKFTLVGPQESPYIENTF